MAFTGVCDVTTASGHEKAKKKEGKKKHLPSAWSAGMLCVENAQSSCWMSAQFVWGTQTLIMSKMYF